MTAHAPGATPLDRDEAAGLIPSSIATQGELNAFEQANIADAEQWALSRVVRLDLFSDRFVRELHRRMLRDVWRWAGRYRRSDKNIGVAWSEVPVAVRRFCDDARYWIDHAVYGWDELGARLHHRLVAIHPFANGNGRHARLLTDLVLARHRQKRFSWGAEELGRIGGARERYLAALRAADLRDLGPLVAFVRS